MRAIQAVRLLRVIAVAAGVMPAATVRAQASVRIGVSAGSATDERGVRSNAATIAPSLGITPHPLIGVTFGGSATQFEQAGWMVGGSATVAARTRGLAGTALSLNAGVGVSRSSFGTTLTVADATPALEWTVNTITLFGGARVVSGRTSVRAQQASPVSLPGQTTLTEARRHSLGSVYGGTWRPFGDDGIPLSAWYREERAAVEGETATDRNTGLAFTSGPVTLNGSAGERIGAGNRSQFASGTISVALAQDVRAEASAGRYPSDRITGTAAGRFVSLGLSFGFGGSGDSPLPMPRGVEPPPRGFTRLSIRAAEARVVDLYGDWNDWTPARARRAENGVWYVDVNLTPGEYRYAFRVNEVEWRVPDGAVAADDGFGGKSAYVTVVRGAATRGTPSREDK